MKKKLLVFLVAVLVLTMGLFAAAQAAQNPLKVSMVLGHNTFTGPEKVTVTIKITNTGESDMPGPVTLYWPNGKQVEDFGSRVLSVGSSVSWHGDWKVTQSELDAGKLTFKIKYSLYDDDGVLKNYTKGLSKALIYEAPAPQVTLDRTIVPSTASKGQEVTVTYTVNNTGNVDVTNVTIQENKAVSSKKATIDSIPAGTSASHTFTFTMGTKDVTSSAAVTYRANGQNWKAAKEETVIAYGEPVLNASVETSKTGGAEGDTVTLTIELTNSGDTDLDNVTVTDPVLGDIVVDQTVPAGETVTVEKEVTITESAAYHITATGEDANGTQVDASANTVTVTMVDPAKDAKLSLVASADRDTVYSLPGNVRFTVDVTNEGESALKDVAVSASGVTLYTFPIIEAGETRTFTRDVSVSMAGQYRFDVKTKDQLNQTVIFSSNVIHIGYAQPTAQPTEAPLVTVAPPKYKDEPIEAEISATFDNIQNVLGYVWKVCGALGIIGLLLVIVGVVGRIRKQAEARGAQDQMELAYARDYTTMSDETRRSHGKNPPKPAEEAEEEQAPAEEPEAVIPQDAEVLEETMSRYYVDGIAEDIQPEVTELPQEEGSRRRRSRRSDN